jgi:uncharacterized protein (TIGR01370 family)
MNIRSVRSWYYQLQGDVPPDVEADCYVIDIDADPSCISSGIVLAYTSIGEAEDYRDYWSSLPKALLLGAENPEWPGNFPVRFWDPGWRRTILRAAASAKDRGFHGLYLDKADVPGDIVARRLSDRSESDLNADMVQLICNISAAEPDLMLILQNAEGLLQDRRLRDVLSGVARESLLADSDRHDAMACYNCFGGPKLAVEYTEDRAVLGKLRSAGFIPLLAAPNRALDGQGMVLA